MDQYSIIGPPSPDKDHEVAPEENSEQSGYSVPPAAETFNAAAPPGAPEDASSWSQEPSLSYSTSSPQTSAGDLDAALQMLVQKAQYISNATGAALALRQGEDMACRAASGSSAPDRGARLQVKTGLTAECLRTGELMRCDNAMTDSRVDLESCKRLGIESIIITPVRQGQTLVGVLELFSAHAYSFQERDVDTVRALAEEIGNLLGQREAPLAAAPEPPLMPPAGHEQSACSACGAQIDSDPVFCAVCGSFQESNPPVASAQATGWKARLSSRRLLVPAVFVVMALVVALAPIPRQQPPVAPPSRPVVQAMARPLAPAAVSPATRSKGAGTALATSPPGSGPEASNNNPTIANSVKQLLGGVSSDFSKLLPVNEKPEPPSNGDPNLKVWVDTRKGYYYCPGDEQYGHTERGSFMTQREAESNYYIPAQVKPCM